MVTNGYSGPVQISKRNKSGVDNSAMEDALREAGFGPAMKIPSAVDALIEEVLGPKAQLLGRRKKHPSHKNPEEREQAQKEYVAHSRSLNQIAQQLHCEGFNEFAALGVLHYAQRRLWTESVKEKSISEREAMGNALKDLDGETRKIIGQFIHHQGEASFQAGLRIGLMTSVWGLKLMAERPERQVPERRELDRCPASRDLDQQCSLPKGHSGPHCEGNEAW